MNWKQQETNLLATGSVLRIKKQDDHKPSCHI